MECAPLASVAVLHVARPAESATAEHPARLVPPSLKFTVPVAVPALPVTIALKVTLWPEDDGLAEEVNATDGVASVPPDPLPVKRTAPMRPDASPETQR